jgi:hypothetical protein
MCDGGGSSDSGSNNVVEVVEKSTNASTGKNVSNYGDSEFRRSQSNTSQQIQKGMAQLVGSLMPIPGVGTLLSGQIRSSIEVDKNGNPIGAKNKTKGSDEGTTSRGTSLGKQAQAQAVASLASTSAPATSTPSTANTTLLSGLAGSQIAKDKLKTKLGQ